VLQTVFWVALLALVAYAAVLANVRAAAEQARRTVRRLPTVSSAHLTRSRGWGAEPHLAPQQAVGDLRG
jgi:hypothetical protein